MRIIIKDILPCTDDGNLDAEFQAPDYDSEFMNIGSSTPITAEDIEEIDRVVNALLDGSIDLDEALQC